jgi:hypothetical protein
MSHRVVVAGLVALLAASSSACSKKPAGDHSGPKASGAAVEEADLAKLTLDELDAKKKEAESGKLALFIFDNNEKDRFVKGHIPGAKWVKFDEVEAKDLPPDKEATLVFYCANEH